MISTNHLVRLFEEQKLEAEFFKREHTKPLFTKHSVRGRLQRTSGKWGGGVVLKFRTFPEGGGVVCESSDVRKFLKKIELPKFLRAL